MENGKADGSVSDVEVLKEEHNVISETRLNFPSKVKGV